MATFSSLLFPLSIIFVIAIASILRLRDTPKQGVKVKPYAVNAAYQQYTPPFSQKLELDIRLPYRRFKQLYPNSNITYDEYKKMQTQSAFKRSLSSQQNHRMVR